VKVEAILLPHLGWTSTTPYLGFDDDPYSAISIWFKVDDIEAAIEKLVALGATPLTPPNADDGNVLALLADA